jgi:hypothetical protein
MVLYLWYLGVGLKFLVSGRLIIREWCRHLPCFSAFVFVCTMKSLFLIPLYGSTMYGEVSRILAPWITALQVGAGIESFFLFARLVPKFRRIGISLGVISIAIAVGLVEWTIPASKADLALIAASAIERGVGFGIAIVLAIAMFFYRMFDKGRPHAAYWHACCLAVLSVTNAIGLQMIQQKVSNVYPMWTMVLGGVIPFAGWLLIVKEAPTDWKVRLFPTPTVHRKRPELNTAVAPL